MRDFRSVQQLLSITGNEMMSFTSKQAFPNLATPTIICMAYDIFRSGLRELVSACDIATKQPVKCLDTPTKMTGNQKNVMDGKCNHRFNFLRLFKT